MSERKPTIAKVRLGRLLQQYRRRVEMTPGDLDGSNGARRTMGKSKLYALERGAASSVKWQDVSALARIYDCSKSETDNLIELADVASQQGMWEVFGVDEAIATFLDMECIARRILSYEAEYVNGLFQTPDYLAALRELAGDPDRGVKMQRQQNVYNRDPMPEIISIMNEAVLKRLVGGRRTMKEQINRLKELDELPSVSLYVLPFKAGAHHSMTVPYIIMEFESAEVFPKTVYLETLHGRRYEEQDATVTLYQQCFDRTLAQAMALKEYLE